jgi:hypothetical protein
MQIIIGCQDFAHMLLMNIGTAFRISGNILKISADQCGK